MNTMAYCKQVMNNLNQCFIPTSPVCPIAKATLTINFIRIYFKLIRICRFHLIFPSIMVNIPCLNEIDSENILEGQLWRHLFLPTFLISLLRCRSFNIISLPPCPRYLLSSHIVKTDGLRVSDALSNYIVVYVML